VLCQLSYAPTGSALSVVATFGARVAAVAASQRRALGALFLILAVFFAGIAVTAFGAEDRAVWVVGVAAAAIALWLASLAARALRRAR
jgi:hypothetical protein